MTSPLTERRLDELLVEASRAVEYPATPDLGSSVLAAIHAEATPNTNRPTQRLLMAAAAVLVLAILGSLALPPTRAAIGEFFGLVQGERIEVLPTAAPTAVPTATQPAVALPSTNPRTTSTPSPSPTPPRTPTPPSALEDIGEPTTLVEAEEAAGFEALLPSAVGAPAAVYLVKYQDFPVIVLQYEQFDVWQASGTTFGYFEKRVPPETVIETPQVAGSFGYWVESGGHIVSFFDAEGAPVAGSERTVERNALIWRQGERFFRLETKLPFEEALAIAESLP
ncbi:MAG: hypothetical protein HOH95_02365 [Dehalococcoidia bacterium]|jgi:hypothetical protein|nr:hypothetical protein [Dehalococcoidia bacterium]